MTTAMTDTPAVAVEDIRVLVENGERFDQGRLLERQPWTRELERLYDAFCTEEEKEPPSRIDPFYYPDGTLYRFFVGTADPNDASNFEVYGMGTLTYRPHERGIGTVGWVDSIYVLPQHRRCGYADRLMSTIIEVARGPLLNMLQLELTSSPKREWANHLYIRHGFILTALGHPGVPGTTNYYRLVL